MKSARKRGGAFLLGALKLAIVASLFTWLITSGRLEAEPLRQVRLDVALAAAAASRLLGCVVLSIRWRVLAAATGLDVPVWQAVRAGFVGRMFDLALPAGLATDGAKAYLGARRNSGRLQEVVSSVVMDRFVGAVTLGFTAIAAALIIPAPGFEAIRSGLLSTGCLLLFAAAGAAAGANLLARQSWKPLREFGEALVAYRGRLPALLRAAAVSFAGQGTVLVGAYFAFAAMGRAVSWTQIGLVHPLVILARTIPATPAGLGVVDTAAEALYALAGNSAGAEMVLLTRGLDLIAAGVGALFLLAPSPVQPTQEKPREAV